MRIKQNNLYGVNDGMILTVSILFFLLRLLVYFLLKLEFDWIEKYIVPLLQYRESFDFCSIIFFIITIFVFICKDARRSRSLFASILLNFVNTITCWNYVPDLWQTIQKICSRLVYGLRTSEGYVAGFGFLIFLAAAVLFRKRLGENILQHMKKNWVSAIKNGTCIYWLIFIILGCFFLTQAIIEIGSSVGFKMTKIQRLIKSSFSVVAIISVVSTIYICIQVARMKKMGKSGPVHVIFLDVCLGVWGMTSIRFYNGELAMSGKAFHDLILAEVEIITFITIILAVILLWRGAVKFLGSGIGIKKLSKRGRRFQVAACISAIISIFVLIAVIIIFMKQREQINNYFSGLSNQAESIKGVMLFWGMVVLLIIAGIIVIGGISLFIYEVFQAVMKEKKNPSEWVVLLVSLALTGLSLYIYYRTGSQDEIGGIAEDVAGVFAFPVVLMAWYVIMTGMLANLSGFLGKSSTIKQNLKKEMENLILDSIKAIFAPLSFSANYLATLREAVLEDTDAEEGGEEKDLQIQKGERGGRCKICLSWLKKHLRRIGGRRR